MEGHEHRLNVLRDDLQSAKDKRIRRLEAQVKELEQQRDEAVAIKSDSARDATNQRAIADTLRARIAELEALVEKLRGCMDGN